MRELGARTKQTCARRQSVGLTVSARILKRRVGVFFPGTYPDCSALSEAVTVSSQSRFGRLSFVSTDGAAVPHLTKRETEILELVVLGITNKSIAGQLGMELREVELLRVGLMNKLGVTTLRELIQLALAPSIKIDRLSTANR